MIYRLADNMLELNGVKVFQDENDNWFYITGKRLSLVQLQELYYFINKEAIEKRARFYGYVERTIKELIYN